MSNRTWITLAVVAFGAMSREQAENAFKDICDNLDLIDTERNVKDLQVAGTDTGGSSLEACVTMSKQYPDLLFEGFVDGTVDDSDDQRKVRIRNGVIETVYADIVFKPFRKLLTESEVQPQAPRQLNRSEIIGIVGRKATREVEGKWVGYLSVATNYASKQSDGQTLYETMWHEVVLPTKELQALAEKISHCDRVRVIGRLRVRREFGADGERLFGEIVASSVEVLGDQNMILPVQTDQE